ncbi:unnamed protein product [Sphagnum balticum]
MIPALFVIPRLITPGLVISVITPAPLATSRKLLLTAPNVITNAPTAPSCPATAQLAGRMAPTSLTSMELYAFPAVLVACAQITSSAIVVNTIPCQNFYEGTRLWANFVYFEVPDWEEDGDKTKYVFVPSADSLANSSRLMEERTLFDINNLDWRFRRTGQTSFFIYDCYMQIVLLAVCWVVLLLAQVIEKRLHWKVVRNAYVFFHRGHEVVIFYISMAMILEWSYFDSSSSERIISLVVCVIFNLYFLGYELFMYYEMIRYPLYIIGSEGYRNCVVKYGCFLRNVRYEDYDVTNLLKITELEMKRAKFIGHAQKFNVKEKCEGTIGLTRALSFNLHFIVSELFKKYDPKGNCDFITVKTIVHVDPNKYQLGDPIDIYKERLTQKITVSYPYDEKVSHKLDEPIPGFPLNP